jgi:hypothetical protein
MWATIDLGYWLCLLLAAPVAGFLVRLFMIQNDCGHGAFFHHRLANDWVGRVIGASRSRLTISGDALTPFTTRLQAISTVAEWAISTH